MTKMILPIILKPRLMKNRYIKKFDKSSAIFMAYAGQGSGSAVIDDRIIKALMMAVNSTTILI